MNPGSRVHSEVDQLLHKAATELRQQLESGRDCRAEIILGNFPSLASDPDRALELVVLEFQLRQQLGQNPQPSDWYLRFPHWREQLRVRLEETPLASLSLSDRLTAVALTPSNSDASQQTLLDVDVEATPVLGRHEILEEIGRGGMGVVYRARDLVLDRIVALKAILSGSLASADETRRFYREARAAAQLRHPNLVPIYGMGLYERQHCFTMALFPRGSLDEHMADYRQDIRRAVGLVVQVARAVQAAHERGIIHRDLKPGNILLDEQGEPAVSDFGLAKRSDVTTTLSLPAQVIGTPAYMSPEQARCETATAASDIWSLGVILYELLTGHRPFISDGVESVMQKITHSEVIPPRRLRSDLPRDLETIVLTCLEKEPTRRYRSAGALADDLERWQRGEPIQARPEPRWQRLRRQVRRHVGIKGIMLAVVLLASLAGLFFLRRTPPDPDQILKEITRQLEQGKPVTLIGETGPPRWYRWTTPHSIPESMLAPDKPFAISTHAMSLLELLPEPPLQRYRFRAEIRHDDHNNALGEVGIYLLHRPYTTTSGSLGHCFCQLAFNDLQGVLGTEHSIGLQSRLYRSWTVEEGRNIRVGSPPPRMFAPAVPKVEKYAGHRPGPWRKLAVEVNPVEIWAFWEEEPIHAQSIDSLRKDTAQIMLRAKEKITNSQDEGFPGVALGLYVFSTQASFRSVVIEPLDR